ncbi:hypothetical protein HON52_00745 [Candidatus Uhrbacteria bacterium]|nr:hypothetical protein [Candidatus Uhrbacteria bacterium]
MQRKTRPKRASWFIWAVLGFIAFFSQFAKGATDSLWLTGGQTFAVFVVVVLSIKYGVGGFTKRDVTALIAAFVGLIIWYITSEAAFALFIVIGIDSIGSILTFIKSYHEPASETLSTWFMSSVSGFFGTLAVGSLSFTLLAYPLYIGIANLLIVVAILLGRKNLQEARDIK